MDFNLDTGIDLLRVKQNVIAYWREDPRMNWPVKVISVQRLDDPRNALGRMVRIRGCVVSAKFVMGRSPAVAERILGLRDGDLRQGAALLRLVHLPTVADFDLAGYTNVPAYPGYPPGLGSNQWIVKVDLLAKVMKVAGPTQTL